MPLALTAVLAFFGKSVRESLTLFAILIPIQAFAVIEAGFTIPPIYILLFLILSGVFLRGDRLSMDFPGGRLVVAYLAVVVISTVYAAVFVDPPQIQFSEWMRFRASAFRSPLQLLLTIFHFSPLFLIAAAVKSRDSAESLMRVYLWTGFVLVIIGMYQILAYIVDLPFKDLTWSINLVPNSNHVNYGMVHIYTAKVTNFSIRDTFIESRMLADYLLSVVPITTALWMVGSERVRERFGKLALPIVSVLGLIAIFFTMSRSAWIFLAAGLLVGGMCISPARFIKRGAIAFIAMIGVTTIMIKFGLFSAGSFTEIIVGRLNLVDIVTDPRVQFLVVLWNVFLEHPILGVGAGNFSIFAAVALDVPVLVSAHGVLWEALGEFGLVGFSLLLGAFIALFTALVKAIRRCDDTASRALLIGLLSAMTALFLNSFTGSDRPPFYLIFCMGMAAVYSRIILKRSNKLKSIS